LTPDGAPFNQPTRVEGSGCAFMVGFSKATVFHIGTGVCLLSKSFSSVVTGEYTFIARLIVLLLVMYSEQDG
jgi:hypothetical protein